MLIVLCFQVTAKNVDTFLTTSANNKPSVMLFSPKPLPSLLYHLVAFSSYKHQSFGFVSLTDSSGEPLRKQFQVDSKEPTVLIFKDDVAVPDVVVRVTWKLNIYWFSDLMVIYGNFGQHQEQLCFNHIILLQASELTSGKLREVVESHKYLHFPRLSSRALFDELCPEERFRSLRRLVSLFLWKISTHYFNIQ